MGERMRAGKLRHHITIQHQSLTQDPSTGAMVHEWAELTKTFASIESTLR